MEIFPFRYQFVSFAYMQNRLRCEIVKYYIVLFQMLADHWCVHLWQFLSKHQKQWGRISKRN